MRCPNCYTCVSSPAYHFQERLHKYGKQYVINWERAKEVMATSRDPIIGRQLLDEVLDYRCNPYFGTVTDCCIGCAISDRNYFGFDFLTTVASIYSVMVLIFPWVIPALFSKTWLVIFMVRQQLLSNEGKLSYASRDAGLAF